MKGDFSRVTHDPAKHYTAVLKQQGRVELDADWNEYVAIQEHLDTTRAADVIGACGSPKIGGGFRIGVKVHLHAIHLEGASTGWAVGSDGRVLTTTDGGTTWSRQNLPAGVRAHLRGVSFVNATQGWAVGDNATILATTDGGTTWSRQNLPAGVSAHLRGVAFVNATQGWAVGDNVTILATNNGGTTWSRQNPPLGVSARLKTVSSVSSTHAWTAGSEGTILATSNGGVTWISQGTPDGLTLSVSPGRLYVDGILCQLEAETTYLNQRDLPSPPAFAPPDPLASPPEPGRTDLVYVKVWQRHVTTVEDGDLREVALGGPDTTTRLQTVCQVRVMTNVGDSTCTGPIVGWPPAPSRGRLTIETVPVSAPESLCLVPPDGGYQGLENKLYRVEIHTPNSAGTPTFTWSRENGSILIPIDEFLTANPMEVRVRHLGQDGSLGLHKQDWVEVLGNESELGPGRGIVTRIKEIREADRVLVLENDVSAISNEGQPKIRRWDMPQGPVAIDTAPIVLERGIQVRFTGNGFRPGDYWVFAARSATAEVERLVDAAPGGTLHHYCRLALIRWDVVGTQVKATITDCRPAFPPLTDIRAEDVSVNDSCTLGVDNLQQVFDKQCQARLLRYVSGDGQEGAADSELPGPLIVGVEDGFGRPQAGVLVTFKVIEGGGLVTVPVSQTDAHGLVSATWRLGPGPVPRENEVVASIVDTRLPVRFHAMAVPVAVGHPPYMVLRYAGGDGQEGTPGSQLPCLLGAGVEDERGLPRPGAKVLFEAEFQDDVLIDAVNQGNHGNRITVTSDSAGMARVLWTLGQQLGCHQALARVASPPQDRALVVEFRALAQRVVESPVWPTVERVSWRHGRPLLLGQLSDGLIVGFSEPMLGATLSPDTFIVTLELAERDLVGNAPGHRPFILPGRLDAQQPDRWRFIPDPRLAPEPVAAWLRSQAELFPNAHPMIRTRVTLKGDAILARDGTRHLDGNAFVRIVPQPEGPVSDLVLRSGDGTRGGDFNSWFYLVLP